MSIANEFVSFAFVGTFVFNVFASAAAKVPAHRQHCRLGAENRSGNYMDVSTIAYYGMATHPAQLDIPISNFIILRVHLSLEYNNLLCADD